MKTLWKGKLFCYLYTESNLVLFKYLYQEQTVNDTLNSGAMEKSVIDLAVHGTVGVIQLLACPGLEDYDV